MSSPGPDPRRWKALALLCSTFFMVVLDIAVVNVALPSIGRDLTFSPENLQWVITAYALTFGGFLLLGGRAADLLGRRSVFIGFLQAGGLFASFLLLTLYVQNVLASPSSRRPARP